MLHHQKTQGFVNGNGVPGGWGGARKLRKIVEKTELFLKNDKLPLHDKAIANGSCVAIYDYAV